MRDRHSPILLAVFLIILCGASVTIAAANTVGRFKPELDCCGVEISCASAHATALSIITTLTSVGEPQGDQNQTTAGSWKNSSVVGAIITGIVALIGAYWQFVYKPQHTSNESTQLAIFVKQRSSGAPVVDANVVLQRATRQEEALTDSLGTVRFQLSKKEQGILRVTVTCKGYHKGSLEIDMPKEDGNYSVYLDSAPSRSTDEQTIPFTTTRPALLTPPQPPSAHESTLTPEQSVQSLESYEIIHPIAEGHYSVVMKCRVKKNGEICIVKRTSAKRVDIAALCEIQRLELPNIAAPRRVWQEGGFVFEELPYVGGARLSHAVARDFGGLTGSVLMSFCEQVGGTLMRLHERGILHRDIHPDNIYMVVYSEDEKSKGGVGPAGQRRSSPWLYEGFSNFSLAWVIVDCTFVALLDNANKSHYVHGSYTPGDGSGATIETDLYSYGATLYYGITGREIPSFQTRKLNAESLTKYPSGCHFSHRFPTYLKGLLSLDPTERSASLSLDISPDSVAPGYTGTLRVSDTTLLKIDVLDNDTRLLEGEDALRYYRQMLQRCKNYSDLWGIGQAEYWIRQLLTAGVRLSEPEEYEN